MSPDLGLRSFAAGDLPALQAIRAAAFAPVFASFRAAVGPGIAAAAFAEAEAEQATLLDSLCVPGSESEVLAQLLFGVDIESISPLQAVRLASAVATLAGEGTGVLDDLRGQAGLADFDVTTTDSGDIALRLGQYISENVYTDVIVSPQETEATINLDLTPDFTVRAGVSTQGETTLGIYFERDY